MRPANGGPQRPAARQRGRLGCVAIVTQCRSLKIADAVRQVRCSSPRSHLPGTKVLLHVSLIKFADHAMPVPHCSTAALHNHEQRLVVQRHCEPEGSNVTIDAAWGPFSWMPPETKERNGKPGLYDNPDRGREQLDRDRSLLRVEETASWRATKRRLRRSETGEVRNAGLGCSRSGNATVRSALLWTQARRLLDVIWHRVCRFCWVRCGGGTSSGAVGRSGWWWWWWWW